MLVLDNATIHRSEMALTIIGTVFTRLNIRMIFLPFYCPELNPCEYVFHVIKARIRREELDTPLLSSLVDALRSISHHLVERLYRHCLPRVHL